MIRFTLAAIVAFFALTVSTFAAPILYSEAVSGDLPASGNPLPTFTLDAGVNTISGTTGFDGDVADFDSFAFIVPTGLQVVIANVTLTDFIGDLPAASWYLNSGSPAAFEGNSLEFIEVDSPGTQNFTTTPLAPDTYNLTAWVLGGVGYSNFTFTFTVIVPEPTSLALLGFAGLALARRRRA
jgi:hypothetical protein